MPSYRVQVEAEAQRRHNIQTACQSPLNRRAFHQYRDQSIDLPIVRLPVELPIYRMENIRTRTRQIRHLRQERLPQGWFVTNQENVEAQQVQHEFLADLSQKRTDSIASIYNELRDEGQTEEILITCNGIVVNGNRRLAAMRQLSPERASLSHVNAMVLPPEASPQDLRKIEIRLQMRPETRLPYDWTDEAIGVRDLKGDGVQDHEIQRLMRLERESDVHQIISRLEEAETYLRDYLNAPDDYARVTGSQQMFTNLERAQRDALRTKPVVVKEGARRVAHILIHNSADLGDRAHEYREAFGRDAEEVLSRLHRAHEAELPPAPATAADSGDIFDEVAEPSSPITQLLPLLSTPDRSLELAREITQIHADINGEREDERRGQEALKNIRKANTALAQVDLSTADADGYPEMRRIIANILVQAQRLQEQLNQPR